MDFVKRYLFELICTGVAAVGILLMVTGARAMPGVLEEMRKAEGVYRNLGSLQSRPVNAEAIAAEERRIELVREDRDKVLSKAEELYGYEPLVKGVLPDGDNLKRIEFRKVYRTAMDNLLKALHYGSTATPVDITLARDRIAREEAERREGGWAQGPSPGPAGPLLTPAGVLTEAGVRNDAMARAQILAAQRIYCYARHFDEPERQGEVSSLDFRAAMKEGETLRPPDLWEVWHAQLGYWIQKDVIEAIAAINNEAAEQAAKRDQHPWVGIMPVKDVISIRAFEGFVPASGERYFGHAPGGYDAALPPGTPETVFTHSGENETFDVTQFTVKLVMDERDIAALVHRISENSFHVPLRVSYVAVPFNRKMDGKIYGSEPTVNVVMDFETILLGKVFRCSMPASICDYYSIPCPPPEECQKEAEG